MQGTPLHTRSITYKKGEVFAFVPATLNKTGGTFVSGVKVQVIGADFRYSYDDDPKDGHFAPDKTILELTEKEAQKIKIVPATDKKEYTVVHTVYIK